MYTEHFSIECRKTKTKLITTTNQNKGKYYKKPMTGLKVNTCKRPRALENVGDQVTIGFNFASDWLRGWREFSRPITERRKAKPMKRRITFDTQLKIALSIWSLLLRPNNFSAKK